MNVLEAKSWLLTLGVYNYFVGKGNNEKFNEIYKLAFGKIDFCEGCSGEVDMAITRLKRHINTLNENDLLTYKKTQMKYTFKKETRLFCYSLGLMVTKHNLTDEIAESIIKENPKHADLFDIAEGIVIKKKKKGKKYSGTVETKNTESDVDSDEGEEGKETNNGTSEE